jgi:transcriptional regulator with XRE-family HTH domain
MSEVARRLGIQQSLMAAYMNGSKNPSAEREKLIRKEIRKIGRELLDI